MFYKCINLLKLNMLYSKKGFFIDINKNNIKILKVFLKLKIIKFIKIDINRKRVFVCINYLNNRPIFKNISNLFKNGDKKYISLYNLKKLTTKKNWILIISTNQGLLNNFEAVEKKIGGLLIAKIWN